MVNPAYVHRFYIEVCMETSLGYRNGGYTSATTTTSIVGFVIFHLGLDCRVHIIRGKSGTPRFKRKLRSSRLLDGQRVHKDFGSLHLSMDGSKQTRY
jgi:hypothetical protein